MSNDFVLGLFLGVIGGLLTALGICYLIYRTEMRKQPPKGLETSFDVKPTLPRNSTDPAVGQIWFLPSRGNPFQEDIRWKITGVENGFVEYGPIYPSTVRWSLDLTNFMRQYRREQ